MGYIMYDPKRIARLISEDPDHRELNQEFIVELAFIGPKHKGGSRKFGAYLLPHNYQSVNFDLIDNPEYYDRCAVYDITNDFKNPILQSMKTIFKKNRCDHAELVISYNDLSTEEQHQQKWKGDIVPNAPKISEFIEEYELEDAYLILYRLQTDSSNSTSLKIAKDYAYKLFEAYKSNIAY
jgi:hypothetical protein